MFRTIGDYFQNTKAIRFIHQSLLTLILRVFWSANFVLLYI
jgi:hypothetical protein